MADPIRTRQEFEPIIRRLSAALKEKYDDFSGISFFGSRHRGGFSDDSDFDIVIMFSRKPGWRKESDVLGVVLEMELEYNIVIDAKVYHEAEIQQQNTPFRVAVTQEGSYYAA